MTLKLDWCSHAAAKYAVEHWHYSKCMPAGKLVKIGVWEAGRFIGAVVFGRGGTNNIGSPYGLAQVECVELVRIALTQHDTPVSRIGAVALRMLKAQSSGLRLIVSFADPEQQHTGAIYQAMNWAYVGLSIPTGGAQYLVTGKWIHTRSLGSKHGTRSLGVLDRLYPGAEKRIPGRKHKYLYPLDPAMRAQIEPLRKPYPKRATSIVADAPVVQAGEEGSTPIVALHTVQVDA